MLYQSRRRIRRIHTRLLVFIIMLIALIKGFEGQISDFSNTYFPNFARQVTIKTINSVVEKVLKDGDYTYDKLADVKYTDGKVSAVETNSASIDELKARITKNAEEEIETISHSTVYIPLGAFTGFSLLSNYGPEIPLSYCLTGSVDTEVESSFESAGINQTIHHIKLIVTANVVTASVDYKDTLVFTTDFELAQTVLVGDIPTTYGGYYVPNYQ